MCCNNGRLFLEQVASFQSFRFQLYSHLLDIFSLNTKWGMQLAIGHMITQTSPPPSPMSLSIDANKCFKEDTKQIYTILLKSSSL